ncbi:MAG TPA: DUF167 domain-containing protein [Planctomycetaceae bacterium]|nr:DUF167 domain-containing protein [Planctomycetaceae bacterium]
MNLRLESTTDGLLLPVKAQPGARRNGVVGVHDGRLKVAVTQVAERGKANAAVLDVLAEAIGLRSSQLEIISGATNREKLVLVRGIDAADLTQRIETVLSK